MRRPGMYRWLGAMASRLLKGKARDGWLRKLPGPLGGWTEHRDFPLPAARPFRDRWAELQQESIEPVTQAATATPSGAAAPSR